VWFTTHKELAAWALESLADEHTYAARFFDAPKAGSAAA
jgi:hypothetical protein